MTQDLMGYKKRKELDEINEIPRKSTKLLYWIIAGILTGVAFLVGALTHFINIVLQ